MYASSSSRRPSLHWVVLTLLLAACGVSVPVPDDSNPQQPQNERGYTDCGSFTSPTTVRCQPGQYCLDQTFSKCEPGCTSDANCLANQVCDKKAGQNVGSCQNTTTPSCSASQPCPSGQACVNGQCTTASTTPPSCSAAQPCPSGKTCVNGLCSAPPPATQCTPRPDGLDGCGNTAICLDSDAEGPAAPACYAFDACDASGRCPTGLYGAVCNDNYFPGKVNICIPGFCRDNTNCPSDWACVKFASNDVLGSCSNRSPGSLCTRSSECLSLSCNIPTGGTVGYCNP